MVEAKRAESRRRTSGSRSSDRSKRAKSRQAQTPAVLSETEIDSPKLQTLSLMAIVSVLVVILWGSARLACNSKTASARKPVTLTTAELTSDPKNAAFEFQQLMARHDYKVARSIATGKVVAEITEAEKRCEVDPGACERERKQLKDTVKSTAALLTSGPKKAKVRVVTYGLPTGKQSFVLDVVSEGDGWKVTDRRPADN
jgi:hypothetical protein